MAQYLQTTSTDDFLKQLLSDTLTPAEQQNVGGARMRPLTSPLTMSVGQGEGVAPGAGPTTRYFSTPEGVASGVIDTPEGAARGLEGLRAGEEAQFPGLTVYRAQLAEQERARRQRMDLVNNLIREGTSAQPDMTRFALLSSMLNLPDFGGTGAVGGRGQAVGGGAQSREYDAFYREGLTKGLNQADAARYANDQLGKAGASTALQKGVGTMAAGLVPGPGGLPLAGAVSQAKGIPNMLDPNAVDLFAQKYIATGVMPPFGIGMGQARKQIVDRVGQIASEQGTTVGDLLARQSGFKANTAELVKTQNMRGTIMPFLLTAQKNLDFAVKLSDAVQRSDIPLINQLVLPFNVRVEGSADVAGLQAAMRVGINETARVLASATASGVQLSDTARKEVEDMMSAPMTAQQIRSVAAVLHNDLKNRVEGFDTHLGFLRQAIGAKQLQAGQPAEQAPQPQQRQRISVEEFMRRGQ